MFFVKNSSDIYAFQMQFFRQSSSTDTIRPHKGLGGSMETLHCYSGGRAESHYKTTAGVGYGYHIRHCIRPNGHFVCVARFNHESPHGKFQNSCCIHRDFRHHQCNFLGADLRQNHCPSCQKIHRPQKWDYSTSENGDWPLHLYVLHALCRDS